MATSLISPIRRDSFIVFQSSNEDIELFNRSDRKFSFSHFALLKIPPIKSPTNFENSLEFRRIQSRFLSGNSPATPNVEGRRVDISESFQNYALNLESLIRSTPTYDPTSLRNSNERIFFKWLKEIGGIRFDQPDQNISNFPDRFVEEKDNRDVGVGNYYDRVVKYIGEIAMQNKVTKVNNNLEEVYLFVPSQVGRFKNPIFKTISDDIYTQETAYTRTTGNPTYIDGYSGSSQQPNILNLLAQYDIQTQGLTYTSINQLDPSDTSLWFDYYGGDNAYLTSKNFQDYSNDLIEVSDGVTSLQFLRSRLDGIVLDLDKDSHYIFNNPSIDTFSKASEKGESFDFNCLLLYYTIEEDGVVETNLYGVLFLEDLVEVGGGEVKIKSKSKIKTSSLLGQTGTGFGIKLNFRIDNANGNIVPDVVTDVNDYQVFSMELFSNVSARLSKILDSYEEVMLENKHLRERNEELLSLLQNNPTNIESILSEINTKLSETPNTQGLSELILKNSKNIDSILKNQTPVPIDLAVLPNFTRGVQGNMTNGVLSLSLKNQDYQDLFVKPLDFSSQNQNMVSIGYGKTLVYFKVDMALSLNNSINILLDDKDGWETKQSVTINFDDRIDFAGNIVNIFTDSKGKVSAGSFQTQIFTGEIVGNSLEIVCIDKNNFRFTVLK